MITGIASLVITAITVGIILGLNTFQNRMVSDDNDGQSCAPNVSQLDAFNDKTGHLLDCYCAQQFSNIAFKVINIKFPDGSFLCS